MKTLIIAEKPSQAQEYAKALGQFNKKDGYLENQNYYITWCYGHLISLENDDVYREEGKWDKSYLPLIPKTYKYKIGPDNTGKTDLGKKKQVSIIETLMKQSKEIINATDADREGELIFLYVYNFLKCKLPFRRLWISSLTKSDIQKGFENLLKSDELYNLGKSAYARAIADWLVGVNGTQASTLQFGNGKLLTIGRVQTAILKIICQRFIKNRDFIKSYTYKLNASHNKFNNNFTSETLVFETKDEAESIFSTLSKQHICIDVENKILKESSPLLFSIDTLIIEANKNYKYSGAETLSIAQTLYEKKLTSYPRTDSTYINDENYSNLKKFLSKFSNDYLETSFTFPIYIPKSVNEKKLTGSHDAIVPTGEVPELDRLSEKETNIFKLIISRCVQSFSDSAEYEKNKMTFENNKTLFYSYSSKLIKKGWKEYLLASNLNDKDTEEQSLDLKISKDERIDVIDFTIKEVESTPPALYSEVNLTADLTNFGKLLKEENPDIIDKIKSNIDINSLQIGTQATRPGIIERLKKLEFIEVSKNKFIPTDNGLKYYEIFKDLQVCDVVTTAIWEMKLKKVAEGTEDIREFYKEITSFTETIVKDIFSKDNTPVVKEEIKENLGKCPKCKKGYIYENKKAFGCSEYKCGCNFTIWKNISNKKITSNIAKTLISKNQTPKIKGFKSKTGKPFEAIIQLDNECNVKIKF